MYMRASLTLILPFFTHRLRGAMEAAAEDPLRARQFEEVCNLSLYKILQCTILYGVWREHGGSEGGGYCAIVLQEYCNRVGDAGGRGNKRRIDSYTKASKFINIL